MPSSGPQTMDSNWEPRVLVVFENISDIDLRVDVALETLRCCFVPWGDHIDHLIAEISTWTSVRRFDEVTEQCRLMDLKKIMLSYNIKVVNIGDMEVARSLARSIARQVHRETALQDALKIVDAYQGLKPKEVFVLHIRALILDCRVEGIGPALMKADTRSRTLIVDELVTWTVMSLEDLYDMHASGDMDETERVQYSMLLKGAVALCSASFSVSDEADGNVANHSKLFGIMAGLFEEYGTIVSCSKIMCWESRLLVMRDEAAKYLAQYDVSAYDALQQRDIHILRLAEILEIPLFKLHGILAEAAATTGQLSQSFLLCRELVMIYGEDASIKTVMSILQKALAYTSGHLRHISDEDLRLLASEFRRLTSYGVLMSDESELAGNFGFMCGVKLTF